ncbi:MFS transporter [Candidatus Poribacteria bacterium]|nr:MFS transporter [Candidatus Poribacteria bacterium]
MQDSSQEKVMNRSLVVVGALLIQLCLGAIYAWSVFTPYLKKAPFNFSNTQTQVIFSVGLAVFAVVMVLAGRWQAKAGPRKVALIGGVVLGAGYILAGLFGKNFISQVIFIGVIGGTGIGFAYVCPIAVGMKWFPDKKGLITGLAVAGFGFGALIWVKLAGSWGHLLENMGVSNVFLIYGIIFAAAVIIGSIWMVNPPRGWKPAGWKPPEESPDGGGGSGTTNFLPAEMLKTPQFYGIWLMFIFSAMAGLMVIGIIKLFGIDALQKSGLTAEQASAAAGTAMAVFYSIANGLGRIIWGTLSDKIGRKTSLILMCFFQGIMMLIFFWMGGNTYLLYLGAAIIGFNFGGNFSLFPAATSDFFGTENVGRNYGWVFTAYGVGGIVGPIMAGAIRDAAAGSGSGSGAWLTAFIVSGVACLVAAVIGLIIKPPRKA